MQIDTNLYADLYGADLSVAQPSSLLPVAWMTDWLPYNYMYSQREIHFQFVNHKVVAHGNYGNLACMGEIFIL